MYIFHGFLKVGMTHSYGNGRRLDDSKALSELNFEVNIICLPAAIFFSFIITFTAENHSNFVILLQIGDYLDVAIS